MAPGSVQGGAQAAVGMYVCACACVHARARVCVCVCQTIVQGQHGGYGLQIAVLGALKPQCLVVCEWGEKGGGGHRVTCNGLLGFGQVGVSHSLLIMLLAI